MTVIRRLSHALLERVNRRYHRVHRLRPVGPILFIGQGRYKGPDKRFADGTELHSGDAIGILHFNNARLNQLGVTTSRAAARGFARLMLESMARLADLSRGDPALSTLPVYHGIVWLPPHGRSQGFVTEPMERGIRRRWLIIYSRLLLWTFAAAPESRRATPDPHHYWLTRKALLNRFPESGQATRGAGQASGQASVQASVQASGQGPGRPWHGPEPG